MLLISFNHGNHADIRFVFDASATLLGLCLESVRLSYIATVFLVGVLFCEFLGLRTHRSFRKKRFGFLKTNALPNG